MSLSINRASALDCNGAGNIKCALALEKCRDVGGDVFVLSDFMKSAFANHLSMMVCAIKYLLVISLIDSPFGIHQEHDSKVGC
ncbi:hypothetical protein [Photobacterium leiognathi]|uniref:hypothetical protein n=1 Tax=Photobacterium leiognathi TaxID=553611 RepID=UPI002739D2BF|nr:hypothetical protein [Photobacterium leiognathi]